MIIELDMSSSTPIYVQLRNQIVKGIGKGKEGTASARERGIASAVGTGTKSCRKWGKGT